MTIGRKLKRERERERELSRGNERGEERKKGRWRRGNAGSQREGKPGIKREKEGN